MRAESHRIAIGYTCGRDKGTFDQGKRHKSTGLNVRKSSRDQKRCAVEDDKAVVLCLSSQPVCATVFCLVLKCNLPDQTVTSPMAIRLQSSSASCRACPFERSGSICFTRFESTCGGNGMQYAAGVVTYFGIPTTGGQQGQHAVANRNATIRLAACLYNCSDDFYPEHIR